MTRATARPTSATALTPVSPEDAETHALLSRAVEEAARLLHADGGMVYLVDADGQRLRFAVDAGIRDGRARQLIRDLRLPLGTGLFGHAVTTGELVSTPDYLEDHGFPHAPLADEIARTAQMRSMAAAPLVAGDEVLGALGAFSSRAGGFSDAELALLRALSDHAASSIANHRLIARLGRSQEELAHRVEAQRTLAEMAAQLTTLHDPAEVLKQTLKAAVRLLKGHGGQIGMITTDPDGTLRWGDGHSLVRDQLTPFTKEDRTPVEEGVSGRAVRERRASWSDDYLADGSFPHEKNSDRIARRLSIHSMIAAPLIADDRPIGAIGVYAETIGAFGPESAELLRLLADQAAIVLTNARLYEELERRVEAQRSLGEIAARITALRDPGDVLQRTLDEAVRLLDADGGRIELVAEGGGLHWAYGHSAVDLPIERDEELDPVEADEGVSGRAVIEGRVVRTGDYLSDTSFTHSGAPDRYIRQHGVRSVMSAPLIGDEGAIGSLTIHSQARDAFDEANAELLEVLASQAAIAVTNARLYEQLRQRIDAMEGLAAISAEIVALRDPAAVLQRTVQEAMRLLDADTAIINPLDPVRELLDWPIAYAPGDGPPDDIPVRLGAGISGRAMSERRVVRTGDYLHDSAFDHGPDLDEYIERRGMRSVMSAPLVSSSGDLGVLTVQARRPHAFKESDEQLLRVLADQAAIAITNARLYDELGNESAALARQIDSQRRLLQINQRLLSTLEPASVLELVADGLKSVVWYDNLGLYRVDADEEVLRPVLARDRNASAVLGFPIPKGQGLTWWSVEHREPVLLNDALHDPRVIQIPGTPLEAEAIIIVPLLSGEEVIGAMNIARSGGQEIAFTDADFELVQLFAGQAAIAVTNARLWEELRERSDAQRTLAEIAAQIAALHDPVTVIQRAVADAARLLRADRAQINLAAEDGTHLERPIAAAPSPPSPDDVTVPLGSGIAGMAAAERRVRWTGDYLGDATFPHDEGDRRIEAQGICSMMSAPLLGPDRLLGTITIQATARNAFDREDAELLKLLADQAAIALTNARLYAELEESERRYRHLVDNSPDIVWSVDADGRFTFFSDSLEARTGWKPAQLLGQPFTVLSGRGSMQAAAAAWEELRHRPEREQRVRLDLPLPDGRIAQTEVAMTGTIVDGRFAGAHGSVRDISERERLEGDLRSQAAELAASQERAHLARELHDSVTQALFSMGLTLRTLELLLRSDPDAARAKLAELRELQKDALAEMRTLIFELRPSSLESDGLVQALRTHATAVQRRTGLTIVVDAEPIERLSLTAEEALYRIGQEALHNTVKHANASNATIRIVREASRVRLSVTDDGGGFAPDEVPRGHLGLIGMRQRAELVGGDLRVESRPGSGTTIEASVPVVE